MLDVRRDAAARAFLEISEQLAFMFGTPADKHALDLAGRPLLGAAVGFDGERSGTLCLVVPVAAAAEVAANILGLEPGEIETEDAAHDALSELLNVVCGHLVGALAGREADFGLQPPQTQAVTADLVAAMLASEDWIGFVLEDSPVLLGLTLDD